MCAEDPLFETLAACVLVLVVKMLFLTVGVGYARVSRKSFATPEDFRLAGVEPNDRRDEGIERWRRAHRNDLEMLLPFFALASVYVLLAPPLLEARIVLFGFTAARVAHTFFYLRASQPQRSASQALAISAMCWMLGASAWRLLVSA